MYECKGKKPQYTDVYFSKKIVEPYNLILRGLNLYRLVNSDDDYVK